MNMKWKIEFIENENFVRITAEGVYNRDEHLQMMQDTLTRDFWIPGLPILLDFQKLTYSETNIQELKQSSHDMLLNNERIGSSKIAFLLGTMQDFNMIQQFELIADEEISAWMHAFLDENQSLRWLLAYRVKQTDNSGGSGF